jgi:uncharacterized membrane protein
VPAGLIALSAAPTFLGMLRLVGFALGRATLPDHERLTARPAPLVLHIVGATTYAVLGALQFAPHLRGRPWHRLAGRALAPLGIVAATAGMWMAATLPPAEAYTPLLRGLRLAAGAAMIASIVAGLWALRRRDLAAHGAWMTRGYAIGVAAGTQFFTVLPYVLLVEERSELVFALLMMAGWAINLAVAEGSLRAARLRSRQFAWILVALAGLVPSSARAQQGDSPVAPIDDEEREERRARLQHLLDTAAESARDRRVLDGAEALAAGVLFTGAGVASWVTPADPGARETRDVLGGVFVGVGALMLAGGAYALSTPSAMEEQRAAYLAALRGSPDTLEAALRETEREIFAREREAKTERTTKALASFVFGAAEIAGGIALATQAKDSSLQWLGGGLIAGGVGAALYGAIALTVRSEEERIADLWRSERALPAGPSRGALTVVPRLGLGSVGLTGSF